MDIIFFVLLKPPRIKVVPLKAKTPIEETEIVPPKLSLAENIILGLDSIRNGQDKISHLPEGVSIVDRKDHMLFIRFTGRPPWRVAYYLQINENLTFSAVVRNIKLKPEKYRHLAGQTIPLLTIISEMLVLLNHEYKGLPVPKEVKKEAVPIWTGETEEDEKGDENKDGGLSWNIDI